MSLGENLQFLRKKNDITQEQLAERLDVSRQSVSKWESDTTYPEMEKLVQLCQMFHLRMDDLIQKYVSYIYVEYKSHYDNHKNIYRINLQDELYSVVFFIFLTIAVAIFMITGLRHADFQQKNPYIENFYTEEEIDRFHKKFSIMITTGVTIIFIGLIIMMGLESVFNEYFRNTLFGADEILSSIFLLLITIAVSILVYAGLQKEKYNIKDYNTAHDKESPEYKRSRLTATICTCLMLTAVIIYLIFGFLNGNWGMPYFVVFPVFGIGCGIVSVIINLKLKNSLRNA